MQTISVPYEVVDHQSTANVNVKVSAAPATKPQSGSCGINFSLNGDAFAATNTCVDYLALSNQVVTDQGNAKSYSYAIKLYDAETVFAPLAGKLQDMHVEGDDLVVKTGNLVNATNFTLKLYVQRRRFLAKDMVLINRVLNANEFSYQAIDDKTGYVHINLEKILGGFQSGKKHVIQLNLDVNLDQGTLLNGGALPSLHQENQITING